MWWLECEANGRRKEGNVQVRARRGDAAELYAGLLTCTIARHAPESRRRWPIARALSRRDRGQCRC